MDSSSTLDGLVKPLLYLRIILPNYFLTPKQRQWLLNPPKKRTYINMIRNSLVNNHIFIIVIIIIFNDNIRLIIPSTWMIELHETADQYSLKSIIQQTWVIGIVCGRFSLFSSNRFSFWSSVRLYFFCRNASSPWTFFTCFRNELGSVYDFWQAGYWQMYSF